MAEEEGATMTSKHPKRCETCKHKLPDCDKEALGSRVCKKIFLEDPKALQIGIPYFIDIVGCASHSSRPHTPAALATDFDCDNTICLDYKSKCGGCIPERCNYQKSLKKQKEQDHDYTIKEGVLDEMESFLDTIEQTATDPGYLDAINTMREYIAESKELAHLRDVWMKISGKIEGEMHGRILP
ncbi:MAG TPA: hypothetical protein PLW50_00730 [Smithellaceae bacterium]|nr:hypothetical protein [Smithellaceae bacterium]